jgi:hypothetical protein
MNITFYAGSIAVVAMIILIIASISAAPALLFTQTAIASIDQGETTTAATTPPPPPASSPSSGIEVSPQPIYQRTPSTSGVTPINQTHIGTTFYANGTLTLPNTTETISTTSTGSSLTSLATQSAIGTETIMTEDGETITTTFYEIFEFPPGAGGANGIAIAVLHTNSTDRLAPLNGTLVVGTDYLYPISEGFTTYWEWVPLPPLLPTTMEESPPSPMNTTTATTTGATTTTADTNATIAIEGEQQQQQQTTPTIPAPLLE